MRVISQSPRFATLPGSSFARAVTALCLSSICLHGATFGPFTYRADGDSITITKYSGKTTGPVVIPAAISGKPVTRIGARAFENCRKITSVEIPSGVARIGNFAFYGCNRMTRVGIPPSVTSIGKFAFSRCRRLEKVTIPAKIGISAFSGCRELFSVTISSGGTSIGQNAFSRCHNLTKLKINSNLKTIGSEAFYRCGRLTEVRIPPSVSLISHDAFRQCDDLIAITVDAENPNYSSQGGILFNREKTVLLLYPQGIYGDYAIPPGVTRVGNSAFHSCVKLTKVTIPSGVTTIGDYAFYGCRTLTQVTIPASVTSVEDYAFYGCPRLASARFLGNAPTLDFEQSYWGRSRAFDATARDFVIYYILGKTGFTTPEWQGYPSVAVPGAAEVGPR